VNEELSRECPEDRWYTLLNLLKGGRGGNNKELDQRGKLRGDGGVSYSVVQKRGTKLSKKETQVEKGFAKKLHKGGHPGDNETGH